MCRKGGRGNVGGGTMRRRKWLRPGFGEVEDPNHRVEEG